VSGALEVLAPGPLTTVQDGGRPGLGALGVSPSGACDRRSFHLANRLVANPEEAAALEVTFGGLGLRARGDVELSTAGARCPIVLEDHRGAHELPHDAVLWVPSGATVRLGAPEAGLRTYVGVRGGVAVEPVLGSRSTDVLAGLGPAPLRAGDVLPVGPDPADLPTVELAPVPDPPGGDLELRVLLGPREDWLGDAGLTALLARTWTVGSESNRTGMRLEGEPVPRAREGELASEGMVRGAVQVPPSGLPVLFLADHPVTGGYPVPVCVVEDDVDVAAQARPGQRLRFVLRRF
jgi:biotin-dependent carboxylase-like uncharacterized protein